MALVRNWRIVKNPGILGEVKKIYERWSLKGCTRITIKFDPFREDSKNVRDFSYLLASYEASKSNPSLVVKTEVVNDRTEPSVTVKLLNGKTLLLKCSHLSLTEIFENVDKYSTPLAPADITEESQVVKEKKKGGKKR